MWAFTLKYFRNFWTFSKIYDCGLYRRSNRLYINETGSFTCKFSRIFWIYACGLYRRRYSRNWKTLTIERLENPQRQPSMSLSVFGKPAPNIVLKHWWHPSRCQYLQNNWLTKIKQIFYKLLFQIRFLKIETTKRTINICPQSANFCCKLNEIKFDKTRKCCKNSTVMFGTNSLIYAWMWFRKA